MPATLPRSIRQITTLQAPRYVSSSFLLSLVSEHFPPLHPLQIQVHPYSIPMRQIVSASRPPFLAPTVHRSRDFIAAHIFERFRSTTSSRQLNGTGESRSGFNALVTRFDAAESCMQLTTSKRCWLCIFAFRRVMSHLPTTPAASCCAAPRQSTDALGVGFVAVGVGADMRPEGVRAAIARRHATVPNVNVANVKRMSDYALCALGVTENDIH